jgi:hypothetical protein
MRHAAAGTLWACLLALSLSGSLRAEDPHELSPALSRPEQSALEAGVLVSRALRFAHDGGSYVGGVSYQVVEVEPELVLAALSDVANWPEALPRTKSAKLLPVRDGLSRVELVQGGTLLEARYTVVLDRADGATIRFWLDPSQPHDIRDVWGFFRVQPLPGGRSLVTVGAALDLGDGLARMLFEDKIASMLLRAPRKIREFVQPRALALSGTLGR